MKTLSSSSFFFFAAFLSRDMSLTGTAHTLLIILLFFKGRTECIRSLTSASRDFCLSMMDDSASTSFQAKMLRDALQSHGEYLRAACQGNGSDRHLLGLRIEALKNGLAMPKIFTDDSYTEMNRFELSTSAMPVTFYKDFLGFGAPSQQSYGCCYCMTAEGLLMVITASSLCPEKNVARFHDEIVRALNDLARVLQSANSKV